MKWKIPNASAPERRGEVTQLATIWPTFPHLTASGPIATAPKPTIDPTMAWVVDTGSPMRVAPSSRVAADASAASFLYFRCVANKGNRDIINLHRCSGFQIFTIFGRQGPGRKPSASAVDPLVIGQDTAVCNCANNTQSVDSIDLQFDSTVVQQQNIPRSHIP